MSTETEAKKHFDRAAIASKAEGKYIMWGALLSGAAFAEGLIAATLFPPAAMASVITLAEAGDNFRRAFRAEKIANRETVLYERVTKPVKVTTSWGSK